jgi:hypothetical protein
MFRLRKLTLACSWKSSGAGGGDGVRFGIFPQTINGLIGTKLSLTCRQGDFAEDLESERKRKGQVDKQML